VHAATSNIAFLKIIAPCNVCISCYCGIQDCGICSTTAPCDVTPSIIGAFHRKELYCKFSQYTIAASPVQEPRDRIPLNLFRYFQPGILLQSNKQMSADAQLRCCTLCNPRKYPNQHKSCSMTSQCPQASPTSCSAISVQTRRGLTLHLLTPCP